MALCTAATAVAADGTWNVNAGGNWSTLSNWNGTIADGAGSTANFVYAISTNPTTVTLDGVNRTIGNLSFQDLTTENATWTLGAAAGLVLTLDSGSAAPSLITVTSANANTRANITATLGGTKGIIIEGRNTTGAFRAATVMQLSGNNVFSGGLTSRGGTVQFSTASANAALGDVNNTVYLQDGGRIGIINSGSVTIAATHQFQLLAGTGGFNIDTGVNATIGGLITGTGTLQKLGSGTLFLNSGNNYSGGTSLTGGFMSLLGANALPVDGTLAMTANGPLFLNGFNQQIGTLTTDANSTVNLGTATLTINRTASSIQAGSITGNGSVYLSGAFTTTFNNSGNSYSGVTTVAEGTLRFSGTGALAGAVVVKAGATTDFFLASGATRTLESMIPGGVSGAGGLGILRVSTTLQVGAAQSYSGATTVTLGTLQTTATEVLPDSSTVVMVSDSGASLIIGFNETIGGLSGGGSAGGNVLLGSNVTLTINQAGDTTYAGMISGDATNRLVKQGIGTLSLNRISTYSGGTTVLGGTLAIGGNAGSVAGNIFVADGARLHFARTDGNVTNLSAMVGGTISGGGGFSVNFTNATGVFAVDSAQSYGGATTLFGGTTRISSSNYLPVGTVMTFAADAISATFHLNNNEQTLAGLAGGGAAGAFVQLNGSKLTLNQAVNTVFTGSILGNSQASLVKQGSGSFTFNGVSTFDAGVTVQGGTFVLGSAGVLESKVTVESGTLAGGGTLFGVQINAGGTHAPGFSPASVNIGGNYTLSGTLAIDLLGSVTTAAANSGLSGSPGTNNDYLTNIATLLINNGATIKLVGLSSIGPDVQGAVAGFNSSNPFSFKIATFTTLGGLGSVLFDLTSFTNNNSIGGGSFSLGTSGNDLFLNFTPGGGPATRTWAGGIDEVWDLTTANWAGPTTYAEGDHVVFDDTGTEKSVTLAATRSPGSVTVSNSVGAGNAYTFSGAAIAGATGLLKQGAGTLVLANNNTYSGVTTVAGGVLALGDGGTSGGITGSIVNNGLVQFDRSNAVTYGGIISGDGAVEVLGGGSVTLTNVHTFTGATTVGDGTLTVADGGALAGGGAVAVNNLGTLVLDGDVAGTIYVNDGGTLTGEGASGDIEVFAGGTFSPGNGVGVFGVTNADLTLHSGAILVFEFRNATGSDFGTDWDFVDLGSGVLHIDANNYAPDNRIKLYIDSHQLLSDVHGGGVDEGPEYNNFDDSAGTYPGDITEYAWLFIRAADIQVDDLQLGSIAGRFEIIDYDANAGVFGSGNPFERPSSSTGEGTFRVVTIGGDLYITYSAIPEPGSLMLVGVAVAAGGYWRRRRKQTSPEASNA